jgi:hypothetical protein
MTLPRVHVQMDRRALGRGRVVVDGRPLPGVRAVGVRHESNCPPAVVVEYLDEQEVTANGTPE